MVGATAVARGRALLWEAIDGIWIHQTEAAACGSSFPRGGAVGTHGRPGLEALTACSVSSRSCGRQVLCVVFLSGKDLGIAIGGALCVLEFLFQGSARSASRLW